MLGKKAERNNHNAYQTFANPKFINNGILTTSAPHRGLTKLWQREEKEASTKEKIYKQKHRPQALKINFILKSRYKLQVSFSIQRKRFEMVYHTLNGLY